MGFDRLLMFFALIFCVSAQLYVLDANALFNTKYDRSITVNAGDRVFIGEHINDANESPSYYVNISDAHTSKKTYKQQVVSAIEEMLEMNKNETVFELRTHHANNHLQANGKYRKDSEEEQGMFKSAIKYGARVASEVITLFLSNAFSGRTLTHLTHKVNQYKRGTECLVVTKPLPLGRTGMFGACMTGGKRCNTQEAEEQIDKAATWASNSVDKFLFKTAFRIAFLNDVSWNICIKVVRNEDYDSYGEVLETLEEMSCPKGYCQGDAFDELPIKHSEL